MVTKKSSTGKDQKLRVKKETIKNLDPSPKSKNVKGGRRRFCNDSRVSCATDMCTVGGCM
jgi:hypothetical protein